MNSWPDDDPEVQEVIAENGGRFRYRGGRWYGGVNPRTGHWDLRVSADPGDALRLSQRVMEKKMERQRREMEEQMREGQEAAGEAAAGAGAGAAPRARRPSLGQWGMGVATAFGGHVASMVAAGAVALTPIIAEAVNVAAQPLGGTGQASAQVGMSLLQFLANSLRSVSRIGGMVVGAALYSVLGPAFGIAFGFLTAELGSLLGNFGQALGQALRGVRGVFEDINRVGQETADVIMRIANNAGMAAEAATRLTMSMQAAGVPLQTIGGLFGHWGARREFLEPRLAVLGIGYEQFQRAPMLTLHDALQGFPDLVRLPMLRTVFGPQAEALYPRIMRPREELVEAQRLVERWAGSPEAFARMQRHVEAMEERVGFLGRMLRVHLLEGFLPVMEAGLQTLLRLWDQNREAIIRFATQTAPREFLNLVTRAVDWLRQHWPEIVQGARDLRDILSDVWNFVRWIADKLREIRDLWPFGHAPAGGGSPPGGGAPGGSGSPTAMGMMPAGAPVQGPLGQIWEGAKTLTWLSAASLGLRYLPRLFGLGAQAAGPGAITEAPLARPLLSLLTGMGRGELLYEAPLLLKAGPAVAGTAGWLATVPGLMEWYASGLQGRQQKDWAFLATMLGSAALGWRYGGPVGALIGLGIGTFAGPVAQWLGGRRRIAEEGTEEEGMRALVEATRQNERLRAAWQAIPHEQRAAWLQAIGAAQPEQRGALFQQMIQAGEAARKSDNVFNRLQQILGNLQHTMEQQRQHGLRVEHREEITVKPVVDPDFLLRLEAQITRRQIQATWREAQQEMS